MLPKGDPLFLFGVDAFDAGEEELGEEPAIEEEVAPLRLFARPSDFVISPPYYLHLIQTYRKARAEPRTRDEREFHEMLQMYRTAIIRA